MVRYEYKQLINKIKLKFLFMFKHKTVTISLKLKPIFFYYKIDGENVLVVLLLQIHRILRHTFLHPQEEEQSCVHPPCYSPWMHAFLSMDGHEIRSRYVNIASLSSSDHRVVM